MKRSAGLRQFHSVRCAVQAQADCDEPWYGPSQLLDWVTLIKGEQVRADAVLPTMEAVSEVQKGQLR
jgi:hypothetical protein